MSAIPRAVACAAAAGVSLALACSTSPRSPTRPPFRVVERWVDRFDRAQATSADDRDAGLADAARLRWTAGDIERQWTRATAGRGALGATFRSPRLGIGSVDDLEHDNRATAEPDRVRRLAAALTAVLEAQAAARMRFLEAYGGLAAEPRRIPSRDVLEQLRSLGYIH